jgi:hypothetical protein
MPSAFLRRLLDTRGAERGDEANEQSPFGGEGRCGGMPPLQPRIHTNGHLLAVPAGPGPCPPVVNHFLHQAVIPTPRARYLNLAGYSAPLRWIHGGREGTKNCSKL